MTQSLFINGRLHAPYFIFVRSEGRYSDADLLRLFGLSAYARVEVSHHLERHAILADDGSWTMIADDWSYTLWHMPSTRPAIEKLGSGCELFACSVGDCDHSFDFVYYSGGRLLRKYVVVDPDFSGGTVAENTGDPLPGETSAFKETNELGIVLSLAFSLGIRAGWSERDIRTYAPVLERPVSER
jgi:hypothetical protein